jgi:hypothetical protein
MAAALDISMSKLVDQRDLRPPRDDRVQIHFLERLALIVDMAAGDDLDALQQGFGLLAAVSLDDAGDDVVAVLLPRMGLLQHLVGLADAGSGADEDAQLADAPLLAARRFKKRFR